MTESTDTKKDEGQKQSAPAAAVQNSPKNGARQEFPPRQNRGWGRKSSSSYGKKPRSRHAISEFAQKVIDVRRVARVVAGGRRFSFSVVIVLGNKKGSVGVGVGKASDTALAIEKAIRNAKKNMIKVDLTPSMSIPHEVETKLGSARILLIPAKGRGLVAGSSARTVLDLAGITDIASKILSRSKNKLNNARVTVRALSLVRNKSI